MGKPVAKPLLKKGLRVQARSHESGSSLIEFVLCFSLFWVPFFFGLWNVGITLVRTIQVTEVCRDAAHMLAFGIDFSQTANQTMLQQIAQGLNLSSSGTSVVILTVVTYVDNTVCNNCTNLNKYVITKRLVVGNSTIVSSAFGTPASADMDSTGSIASSTYLNDPTCVATGFSVLMPVTGGVPALSVGQSANIGEMTLKSIDLGNRLSSARSIF